MAKEIVGEEEEGKEGLAINNVLKRQNMNNIFIMLIMNAVDWSGRDHTIAQSNSFESLGSLSTLFREP